MLGEAWQRRTLAVREVRARTLGGSAGKQPRGRLLVKDTTFRVSRNVVSTNKQNNFFGLLKTNFTISWPNKQTMFRMFSF